MVNVKSCCLLLFIFVFYVLKSLCTKCCYLIIILMFWQINDRIRKYMTMQIIHPALSILVNLVCPPPSISIKPPGVAQGQQSSSVQVPNGSTSATDTRERQLERNVSEKNVLMSSQGEPTGGAAVASGVVGDRRITLGQGAGCAGLAAQLELGYRQAREAVRANNGIKVLLHLLHPRIFTPPAALDCLRALACRVLLGLARDNTIAHILTKLQVCGVLKRLHIELLFYVLHFRNYF